jgi:hypothetical protein
MSILATVVSIECIGCGKSIHRLAYCYSPSLLASCKRVVPSYCPAEAGGVTGCFAGICE